jgi:hypothetical protein
VLTPSRTVSEIPQAARGFYVNFANGQVDGRILSLDIAKNTSNPATYAAIEFCLENRCSISSNEAGRVIVNFGAEGDAQTEARIKAFSERHKSLGDAVRRARDHPAIISPKDQTYVTANGLQDDAYLYPNDEGLGFKGNGAAGWKAHFPVGGKVGDPLVDRGLLTAAPGGKALNDPLAKETLLYAAREGKAAKLGHGGDVASGKGMTLYLGSMEDAKKAAGELEGHVANRPPIAEAAKGNMQLRKNFAVRFDPGYDSTFHQYGRDGIPHLNSSKLASLTDEQAVAATRYSIEPLQERFGEYFGGKDTNWLEDRKAGGRAIPSVDVTTADASLQSTPTGQRIPPPSAPPPPPLKTATAADASLQATPAGQRIPPPSAPPPPPLKTATAADASLQSTPAGQRLPPPSAPPPPALKSAKAPEVAQNVETDTKSGNATTRYREHARSGRPGQDFGPQATDMETGRSVNEMGRRINPEQTVQERVAMREHMAATRPTAANDPKPTTPRVNAIEEGLGVVPKVAQEAEAVAQTGGRMEAIKNALQTDVGQALKSASKTVAAKLAPLAEAAEPVLKPLVKVAAPVVKVGAELVERSATPIAVGAVVYETATASKEKKVQAAVEGTAELAGTLLVPVVGVPVTIGKAAAGVIKEHGIDDVLRREDRRMSEQSVDLKNAKSMAYQYHDDLVAKGASFGKHWSFDLGNERNRQLLKETLTEKAAEIENQAAELNRPKLFEPSSWIKLSFGENKNKREDLNSDLNSVNAAIGELQNHDAARNAIAGVMDAMQRRDAFALASSQSPGMRLSFSEHSGDPLPPSVPGGTGGRYR